MSECLQLPSELVLLSTAYIEFINRALDVLLLLPLFFLKRATVLLIFLSELATMLLQLLLELLVDP